jgi:hypothetical protein
MTPKAGAGGPDPTTPVQPTFHGMPQRGLGALTSSPSTQGRYGRMFRQLPPAVFGSSDAQVVANLSELAARIIQPTEAEQAPETVDPDENPRIPAGYTYLGQFIDHDLTFDPVSSLQRQNDPDALLDFRTPRFDLDNLYGRGPSEQPYLYQPDDHTKLLLGAEVSKDPAFAGPDLPRNANGRALIGDPRNDENLIVSQLQSLFLRFHNAVVDAVAAETGRTEEDLFKEAQRVVRWHYQWIVVHDFLAKHIVGGEVVEDILRGESYAVGGSSLGATGNVLRPRLLFYHFNEEPFMPVEFSVAAYRFGHTMIRPSYFINEKVEGFDQGKRLKIFSANTDPANLENLNGFRPLPPEWGFQWRFFYELDPEHPAQRSYKLDDELSNPLGDLPPTEAPTPDILSLATRNLVRGYRLGLPSGQDVARAMGLEPLSDADLDLTSGALQGSAPLWYYVLREAKVQGESQTLGPVGGRIVAEVLIGLLAADPLSYLNVQPTWKPTLVDTPGAEFGMPELVRFAKADVAPAAAPPAPAK